MQEEGNGDAETIKMHSCTVQNGSEGIPQRLRQERSALRFKDANRMLV